MVEHDPSLVSALDPSRNYGKRTYEQVVDEVNTGLLILSPGHAGLPVIRDATTLTRQAGTAAPVRTNLAANEASRKYFREQFAEHAPELYNAAYLAVMNKGDMKALELLLKYGVGDHREAGSDAGSRAVEALMDLAKNARTERIIQVNE